MFNISFLLPTVRVMVASAKPDVTMKEKIPNDPRQQARTRIFPGPVMVVVLLALGVSVSCRTTGVTPAAPGSAAGENVGQAAGGAPTYAADVAPILEQKCVSCHGRFLPQKGLRLHSREAIFAGGDSGAAVVPGSPLSSPLYTALRLPATDPRHMPPVAGGRPLSSGEIATIRDWIARGAH